MDIITHIRTLRAHFEISPAIKIKALITSKNSEDIKSLKNNAGYISLLAKIEDLQIIENADKPKLSVSAISGPFSIYIPMGGLIDIEKEKKRITKEHLKTDTELRLWSKKLENGNFVKFAPKEEIAKINQRKADARDKIEKLEVLLKGLNEKI